MPRPSLDSGDVRRHNLGLVATTLARLGPRSRSELADATGLTRGAVTSLVAALADAGLVREAESVAAEGRGRPRTLLELSGDDIALVTAAVDADHATALASTLSAGRLVEHRLRHGRPMGDPGPVADALAAVVARTLDELHASGRRAVALTVIAYAPVGGHPPIVLADTDLAWGPVDLVGLLRERLPGVDAALMRGIRLVADATVAAVAEHAAAGSPADLLYLKSDSGIGGALVARGELVTGRHGIAGAFGHLPIVADGAQCSCGQRGCLVTVAGPDAVLAAAGLDHLARTDGLAAALAEFVRRVGAGEPAAAAAWAGAADWIARTMQVLAMATDPDCIVLGGYWARMSDDLAQRFAANRPVVDGRTVDGPVVVASAYGADAAIAGAERAMRLDALEDPLALAQS
ncbi:ROK family protein [Agromyces bauzanensis]